MQCSHFSRESDDQWVYLFTLRGNKFGRRRGAQCSRPRSTSGICGTSRLQMQAFQLRQNNRDLHVFSCFSMVAKQEGNFIQTCGGFVLTYRDQLKGGPVLLSMTQASTGRKFSQPRAHLLAGPCTMACMFSRISCVGSIY